jgi:hypothetical protein
MRLEMTAWDEALDLDGESDPVVDASAQTRRDGGL